MEVLKTPLAGLLVIKPLVIEDQRGYFMESYKHNVLKEFGCEETFVQDNESMSERSVLRGLHFQNHPHAQAKLVRVIKGRILDFSVDIRKNSVTYGQHYGIEISGKNKISLLIPEGFAHGFVTLEDETILNYKCSNYYNKEAEQTLLWNDESLNIDWKVENPVLSPKDLQGEAFSTFDSKF